MIHPDTKLSFINEEIGFGVFATQFIPKGTITWILDGLDQRFDQSYIDSLDILRQEQIKKYVYRDGKGTCIFCWDIARYENHSFNANTLTTPYDFDIAVQDIHPGEQITIDYGLINMITTFDCLPESGSYRTKITSDDIPRFYKEWDEKIADAIQYFNQVEQPLKYLISEKHSEKIEAIFQENIKIDSTLCLYLDKRSKTLVK